MPPKSRQDRAGGPIAGGPSREAGETGKARKSPISTIILTIAELIVLTIMIGAGMIICDYRCSRNLDAIDITWEEMQQGGRR